VYVAPRDRYELRSPSEALPMLYVAVVLIGIEVASEPLNWTSSPEALPSKTFPLKVAVPAQDRALMLRSFVPSEVPFIMSVKFVFTWPASAAVPLLNEYVTEIDAI